MINRPIERRISCRRDSQNVVVTFRDADGSQFLSLTVDEACALSDHVICEIMDHSRAQRFGFPRKGGIELCNMVLSTAEATQLYVALKRMIQNVESSFCVSSPAHVNWQDEGF